MTSTLHPQASWWPPLLGRQLALVAGLAFSVLSAGTASSAMATDLKGSFRGNAFGTEANAKAGDVAVSLGRSAYLPCPCQGTNGKTLTNEITTLKAREVLSAAAVRSTVYTRRDATTALNVSTSTISGLNLFNGLITATTVKAVANTNATSSALSGSSIGSTFLNLKIAGKTISANIAANSVINLAGIGKVTLKKVTNLKSSTRSDTTVEMLVVDVTVANPFKLDVGARIVVGHAFSGYTRTASNVIVGGQAYVTDANTAIGSTLQNRIGRAAFVSFYCESTNGQARTNNVAGLGIATILTIGTGDTTAIGGPTSTGGTARTTAKVQSVKLLNGLITASIVTAAAEEQIVNGKVTRSTKGTSFVGLKVLGISLPVNVPANTKIILPTIGYVILNEQIIPTSTGNARTQVNGIHIKVTKSNLLKLPINSEIIIAHADAFVQK